MFVLFFFVKCEITVYSGVYCFVIWIS